jgi:AraC family transcriptional regulator
MQSASHQPAASALRRFAMASSWYAELLPRDPYQAVYTPEAPIIGFAFESQVGVHSFGSDRRVSFRARPNGLAYVPAGCDVYSSSNHGGEYLRITLACEPSHPRGYAHRFSDAIDHVAIAAAHELRRHLLSNDRDPLLCERCVQTLEERVGWVLKTTAVAPPPRSWMTPRRLRLVDEFIEARLDSKVTIQELAGALGLSAGFFSRAFKSAVGKAPHDYIVDCRISRARRLLVGTELDLTTIALASGFASHAHMTTTFRSRLGISPGALRRRIDRVFFEH